MRKVSFLILALIALVSILNAVPRELVVVEVGTGTWCVYCPGAAMGCHDLEANGHPVAIVKNHNGDPYANTFSNARNSYYAVSGYPTAFFDGQNASVGGNASSSLYASYLPKVTSRMAVPSKYTIAATGSNDGLGFSIDVVVAKPEADTNTNVVLHAVVTESDIPQVWFNQTTVDNVNRLMIPNQNGTAVSLATGETVTIPLNFNIQSTWNLAKLELVLFLQNTTTKEVLQGKKYPLAGLAGALPVSTTNLSFPDTYATGTATLPITITNFFDTAASGTISSSNPAFTTSPSNFNIPGGQAQQVNIHFAPSQAQTYNGTITINSNLYNHPVIEIAVSGMGFLNAAPIAQDVMVVGPPVIHQYLNSSYTFYDADGNTEGVTTYQWYRIAGAQPQAIANATQPNYKTTPDDLGAQIACEITPRDQYGMAGVPTMSEPTIPIEGLPAPRNLQASETDPGTVVCTWERPMHFDSKGFVGYRVYRNDLLVNTITNPSNTTFTDTWLLDGAYTYYVRSLFNDPMTVSDPSNSVIVNVGETSNDEDVVALVESLTASPNPFTAQTSLVLRSKANSPVNVKLYNIKGQMVRNLQSQTDATGIVNLVWDANDEQGRALPSGIYFYRFDGVQRKHSGRLILSR